MHMAEDMELLRQYADHDSQEAFQILLERHVNLVYSTALRQVGDSTLAEEVTQTTFIILARKAGALGRGVILSGWLYRTTRFASMHARRTETRRKKWEQEAASMQKEEP